MSVVLAERWPEPLPDWHIGTDLKTVYDWEWERVCLYCFKGLCEYCEGGLSGSGLPCVCGSFAHVEEYQRVE